MTVIPPLSPSLDGRVRVDVLLDPASITAAFQADVYAGLTVPEHQIAAKWVWTPEGSEFFTRKAKEEEKYYQGRAEEALLREYAAEFTSQGDPTVLVELGAGTAGAATKTRLLLDAMARAGRLRSFVPVDIDEGTLRQMVAGIADTYPTAHVHGVVADLDEPHHLQAIPRDGRRLIAFLGGTIGNYWPDERSAFLKTVAGTLGPADGFLLGVDLVKDPRRLADAYDNELSEQIERVLLNRINEELGANFNQKFWGYKVRYSHVGQHVVMALVAKHPHRVRVEALALDVSFERGHELRRKIAWKSSHDGVAENFEAAGLSLAGWWTDGDVAIALGVPAGSTGGGPGDAHRGP